MAQLPPDGEWLVQMVGDDVVIVVNRYSQVEIVSFDPGDLDAAGRAQGVIANDDRLTPEQKSIAHFWCGYFYAHARNGKASL
jgi:hypothetical protein